MSDSEVSMGSIVSGMATSVTTRTENDGINLREVVLDGLNHDTKNAIIEYLKANQLDVTGLDYETYTVDLSKWDRNTSEDFIEMLQAMIGKLPELGGRRDAGWSESFSEPGESAVSEDQATSKVPPSDDVSLSDAAIASIEGKPGKAVKSKSLERRLPIQPHPAEELDFEYLSPRRFPLHPSPIYQRDELLNVKPMLISEETRSTMGSADIAIGKQSVTKKGHHFTSIRKFIGYPFKFLKRLKIRRFFRKHSILRKSREEKMKKEKAFAVYSSLLQEGPRLGREFRASLSKSPQNAWRTIGTNTATAWDDDICSTTSACSRVNVGVSVVARTVEVAVNTPWMFHPYPEMIQQEIPKVFTEPEEQFDPGCPCNAFTSTSLCQCIAKCMKSICDSENDSSENLNEDLRHQRAELEEVRFLLHGALNLLGKARNGEENGSASID